LNPLKQAVPQTKTLCLLASDCGRKLLGIANHDQGLNLLQAAWQEVLIDIGTALQHA